MNNSFPRLIDGMCATLRSEVLSRLDDEFARGQVYGVINLLTTFKARADWSAGFLTEQVEAQRRALAMVETVAGELPLPMDSMPAPRGAGDSKSDSRSIEALLAARDEGNHAIGAWIAWLDAGRGTIPAEAAGRIEKALRVAMRAEIDVELKNSPRPLFAEMSSGREG